MDRGRGRDKGASTSSSSSVEGDTRWAGGPYPKRRANSSSEEGPGRDAKYKRTLSDARRKTR